MHAFPVPSGAELLARTLRGLERIAAAEVTQRLGPCSIELGHREVRFQVPRLTREILDLGTADDAFLVLYDGPPIGHRRADLAQLGRASAAVDLADTGARLAPIRRVASGAFDVSASFLGRRNYSRYDVEDRIGDALRAASGWRYLARRSGLPARTDLSLRVHLTTERTTVAVRISARPLHRRAYRVASRPGALHPPLARALALLAAPSPCRVLLDPFCGTGTIPIEARLASRTVRSVGMDIDPAAIAAARANSAAASVAVTLSTADASRLPLAEDSVDAVATNPPWGTRVRPAGAVSAGLTPFWPELARVLQPSGRVAVLGAPSLRLPADWAIRERVSVRVSGALADLVVLARESEGE